MAAEWKMGPVAIHADRAHQHPTSGVASGRRTDSFMHQSGKVELVYYKER